VKQISERHPASAGGAPQETTLARETPPDTAAEPICGSACDSIGTKIERH
jgi:hypothetical protein